MTFLNIAAKVGVGAVVGAAIAEAVYAKHLEDRAVQECVEKEVIFTKYEHHPGGFFSTRDRPRVTIAAIEFDEEGKRFDYEARSPSGQILMNFLEWHDRRNKIYRWGQDPFDRLRLCEGT